MGVCLSPSINLGNFIIIYVLEDDTIFDSLSSTVTSKWVALIGNPVPLSEISFPPFILPDDGDTDNNVRGISNAVRAELSEYP